MADSPTRAKIRLSLQAGGMPRLIALGQRRTPFDDAYHYVLSRSWPAFFLIMVGFFLLVNALFALGYFAMPGGVQNARPGSYEDAFYFSVQTMATIGYGGMYPTSRAAHALVVLEAVTGILGVALVTGLTFAKFARPSARVLFCEKAVINLRNGVPHLMFRMANWRHNQVVEAQLRVILLITERTQEGEEHRIPLDLPLTRERTAMFFLTWTAMHRIDERSPFHGATKDEVMARLRAQRAELYLNLMGQDETFAQTIHARYRYQIEDIAWHARFADVLSVAEDGTRTIDYRVFHEVIPLGGAEKDGTDDSPP